MQYQEFLDSKASTIQATGFKPDRLNPNLFLFQRDIVEWALQLGKAAIFCGCGLGKSISQLAWADAIADRTGGKVLIVAPLSVTQQTHNEGVKFGIYTRVSKSGNRQREDRIVITNYQSLHKFSAADFVGVVLDECFTPDTLIDTPTGQKQIKDIRVGDLIINAYGIDIVADVHRREVQYAVKLTINGKSIISSPNHPYLTTSGWVGAQDITPSDFLIPTSEAMRILRSEFCDTDISSSQEEVLQQILFSELADETARTLGESTYAGNSQKEGGIKIPIPEIGHTRSDRTSRANPYIESDVEHRNSIESLPKIETDEPQTFRAWGKWDGDDSTTTEIGGCTIKRMDRGVCLVTGGTDTRISNLLQDRHRQSQSENRYRSGWEYSPNVNRERSRYQEDGNVEFYGVDSLEVLERGHHELDRYRDADGKLYFYDIGATFHPSFSVNGICVHNSSVLKGQSSATRAQIIEMFAKTQYKLACTATPSPNDYVELGNHADFLGVCSSTEMLATYFTHDGGDTSKWRLKGHAKREFWKWVSGWAVTIEKPSNIGYSDDGYDLPPIEYHEHVVDVVMAPDDGQLFKLEASDLMDRRRSRRNSIDDRVLKCAELVNNSDEQWLVWCDLNDEGDALESAIDGAIQIAGKHSDEQKESRMAGFIDGSHRVLVSKASMSGFGINLQNCHNIAFVGMSDSYEQLYQAIRRCWRFGQTKQVHVHFITASSDGAVVRNIKRKERDMEVMIKAMIEEVSIGQDLKPTVNETIEYVTDKSSGDGWDLYHGDCVEVVGKLSDNSIDFSIYSPPFSSLYTYSNSTRDMGNSKSDEQFYKHYEFLMSEMYRVIKPGRLMSFHCMNLPTSKQNDGYIGIKDFRGDLIRMCQKVGFIYHSEVVIFKDPVVAMQRTKALGLLHKQVKKDSAMSRQGIPDYLVTMRKPGVNESPIAGKFDHFAGEEGHGLSTETIENPTDRDSINIWQRYASPVWMDIDPSKTLQAKSARADEDERHVCPLQLQVIERCMQLWSNPNDLVLDPFNGIGSSGVIALEMGRRYIGSELKKSYYDQAKLNLEIAASKKNQLSLFD